MFKHKKKDKCVAIHRNVMAFSIEVHVYFVIQEIGWWFLSSSSNTKIVEREEEEGKRF